MNWIELNCIVLCLGIGKGPILYSLLLHMNQQNQIISPSYLCFCSNAEESEKIPNIFLHKFDNHNYWIGRLLVVHHYSSMGRLHQPRSTPWTKNFGKWSSQTKSSFSSNKLKYLYCIDEDGCFILVTTLFIRPTLQMLQMIWFKWFVWHVGGVFYIMNLYKTRS